MDILRLYRDQHLLSELAVGERPLEVGSASSCDIVLDDPELLGRHWLIARRGGSLFAYDVSRGRHGSSRGEHLALDRPFVLGRYHRLIRSASAARALASLAGPPTERLSTDVPPAGGLRVLIGRGSDARGVRIGERPLCVGRGDDNDIVLSDRAASARHCRLEPTARGVVVRDLESSNGTFVGGVRVASALVGAGAQVRVGRTDLRLVEVSAGAVAVRARAGGMIARSSAMLEVVAEARRAARLPWPVLILGESGSGKEGIARLLHSDGPRASAPFVAINAGAVAASLIESELFGHERGAFTGANQQRRGVFEQADGGTLFLDEVGELPLALQANLLRVLETGELRRLGSEASVQIDVRIVCATHRDLRAMVDGGRFRRDLFFRMAGLVIEIPPLRERPEDVEALARHFVAELAREAGPRDISDDALALLRSHAWPGNARELRNVLMAAVAASPAGCIETDDIRFALQRLGALVPAAVDAASVARAVQAHGGNKSAAARALGLPRSTLRDRLRERSTIEG